MAKSKITQYADEVRKRINDGHTLNQIADWLGVKTQVLRVWLYRNAAKYDITEPQVFHNWTHPEEVFLWESRKHVANFHAIRYFWHYAIHSTPPSVSAMKARVKLLKARGWGKGQTT